MNAPTSGDVYELDQYLAPDIKLTTRGINTVGLCDHKHFPPWVLIVGGQAAVRTLKVSSSGRRNPLTIMANLSRFHPDKGMTTQEHEAQKAKRAAGKVKFIPKEEIKAKFYGRRKR